MKFRIVSTVTVLIGLFSLIDMPGRAECLGPVATSSSKFPCMDKSIVTSDFHPPTLLQVEESPSKSPGKAFVLSLLVPGLGEWYAGSPSRAKIFLAAEAAVWSGFAAFEHYSAWKERDYKLLAADRAGVDPDGKNDDFYKNVGLFEDVWSYNEDRLHIRDMNDVYWDEDFYFWQWDTPESQAKYTELRESSRKAHRRALNMVGAAVFNRFISAIDAVRTARAFNKDKAKEKAGLSLHMKLKGSLKNPKALFVLKKTF